MRYQILPTYRQITLVAMLCIVCLCSYTLGTVGAAQKKNEQSHRFLQKHGYQTDTPEQTQEALSDASVFGLACRNHALIILTEQMGTEAVPILKEFLYNDEKKAVRITAARLLRTLGDQSGLAVMQQ
ncbi:MAG: HEAT repeat domain-containing protein, partial [Planctomycetota bacterium]